MREAAGAWETMALRRASITIRRVELLAHPAGPLPPFLAPSHAHHHPDTDRRHDQGGVRSRALRASGRDPGAGLAGRVPGVVAPDVCACASVQASRPEKRPPTARADYCIRAVACLWLPTANARLIALVGLVGSMSGLLINTAVIAPALKFHPRLRPRTLPAARRRLVSDARRLRRCAGGWRFPPPSGRASRHC